MANLEDKLEALRWIVGQKYNAQIVKISGPPNKDESRLVLRNDKGDTLVRTIKQVTTERTNIEWDNLLRHHKENPIDHSILERVIMQDLKIPKKPLPEIEPPVVEQKKGLFAKLKNKFRRRPR